MAIEKLLIALSLQQVPASLHTRQQDQPDQSRRDMFLRRTPRLAARRPLLAVSSALSRPAASRLTLARQLSTKPVPPGSAYAVLGVSRDIDDASLKAVYKESLPIDSLGNPMLIIC